MSNFQTNSWQALLHSFPNVSTYAFLTWNAICCPTTGTHYLTTAPYLPVSPHNLILSGFPWFGLSWCTPSYCWHLLLSSLWAADGHPVVFLPQLTVPAPRVGVQEAESKQTCQHQSRLSAICPHPQLPVPICWQWMELPPGKARASELYPLWLGSCAFWAPVFSSFFSFQGKQKEKKRWRHFVGKPGVRLCSRGLSPTVKCEF